MSVNPDWFELGNCIALAIGPFGGAAYCKVQLKTSPQRTLACSPGLPLFSAMFSAPGEPGLLQRKATLSTCNPHEAINRQGNIIGINTKMIHFY